MSEKCRICGKTIAMTRKHFPVITEPIIICNFCVEDIFANYQEVSREKYIVGKDVCEQIERIIERSELNREDKALMREVLQAYSTSDETDQHSREVRELINTLVFGAEESDIKRIAIEHLVASQHFSSEEQKKFSRLIEEATVKFPKNLEMLEVMDVIAGYEEMEAYLDGENDEEYYDDEYDEEDEERDEEYDEVNAAAEEQSKSRTSTVESPRISAISAIPKVLEDIKGQDDGVIQIGRLIYRHMMRATYNSQHPEDQLTLKENFIVVGPTGVGKTATIEAYCKAVGLPYVIVDMTSVTKVGWKGDDISEYFEKLIKAANGNMQLAEMGMIIMDEGDKNMKKSRDAGEDPGGQSLMLEMLKKIEGSDVSLGRGRFFNTRNVLFVCIGTYTDVYEARKERLSEKKRLGFGSTDVKPVIRQETPEFTGDDFKKSGILGEWIGRFPVIVEFKALTSKEYPIILRKSKKSAFLQNQKLMKFAYGVELILTPEGENKIVEKTVKYDIGARGLNRAIAELLKEIEMKLIMNEEKCKRIIIGETIMYE